MNPTNNTIAEAMKLRADEARVEQLLRISRLADEFEKHLNEFFADKFAHPGEQVALVRATLDGFEARFFGRYLDATGNEQRCQSSLLPLGGKSTALLDEIEQCLRDEGFATNREVDSLWTVLEATMPRRS